MMKSFKAILATLLMAALVAVGLTGCATHKRTAIGAGTGAVVGGVAGAVIGHQSDHAVEGAAIGAAAGAALGGGIGYYLDRRAQRLEQIEDVEVEPEPEAGMVRIILSDTVLFEHDSSAISAMGTSKLREVAEALREESGERVVVRGYTSSDGSDAYNQSLSERRAHNVRNTLIGYGVAPGRITAVGMGESNPLESNATESGRARNRRVEIELFPAED